MQYIGYVYSVLEYSVVYLKYEHFDARAVTCGRVFVGGGAAQRKAARRGGAII